MIHYDINYNRLGLALVPLKLRQPILMGLIYVMLSGVRRAASVFGSYREQTNYRLTHNGQVCYLKAVLNDRFDPTQRRITIDDVDAGESLLIYKRELEKPLRIYRRVADKAVILTKRAFTGSDAVDFAVVVPAELRGSFDEEQMRALVTLYKLTSKRFTIIYQ